MISTNNLSHRVWGGLMPIALLTTTAIAGLCAYKFYHEFIKENEFNDLVDELSHEEETIAEKCISPGLSEEAEYFCDFDLKPDRSDVSGEPTLTYNKNTLDVENYWVVSRPRHYARCVIAQTKNRFGTPEDTTANRLAVRKYLLDTMTAHRVRPSHINQLIDICVTMVFVDNNVQNYAKQLEKCAHMLIRKHKYRWTWVKKLVNFFYPRMSTNMQ